MAGLIPQDFIDELINRTDIIDVIGNHVQLRKAGKDYQGLCPFHNEKSPSFTVSQVKQFYHCFGCGANGSALGFLMEHNHLDFVEAIKELASKAGMQIPEADQAQRPRANHDPIYKMLDQAMHFYAQQLRHHSSKQLAVDYLKKRGLSGQIAAAYQIGYAPQGWDNLIKGVTEAEDKLTLLLKAGLIIEKNEEGKESRHYDRFRQRIIFPIRDYKGRVIGFGGRILDQGEPKYLNSPETPVFHKGRELYGLFEARQRCRDLSQMIVVEGYMDVVALAQFGINHAVATLGTATTSEHLKRLFRSCREIIFCFDGDPAGQRAAWKALELSLPLLKEGYAVQFLFLPDGEDPDSLVRAKGADYFTNAKNFTPLSEFLFSSLQQQADLNNLEGRAQLVDLANPLISKIPKGALRSLMQQRLAKLSELDSAQIEAMAPTAELASKPPPVRRAMQQNNRFTRSLTEQAIHILLHHPQFAHEIELPASLQQLDDPHIEFMFQLIEVIHQQADINTGQLLEHWRQSELIEILNKLLPGRKELGEEAIRAEYTGILESLNNNLTKQHRISAIQTAQGQLTEQVKNIYKRSDN